MTDAGREPAEVAALRRVADAAQELANARPNWHAHMASLLLALAALPPRKEST